VGSLKRATEFIEDVGFALLFPKERLALPSLWEVVSDRPIRDLAKEWGADAERVWRWKDELPRRGLAWYGRFLRGKPSFLSVSLLGELYPRSGQPADFEEEKTLSPDGYRIARILLRSGPLSTSALREALDVEGRRGGERFSAAITELGRRLVVTHFGVEDEGAGWPSAVMELTARAFEPAVQDRETGHLNAVRRFLSTMITARPRDLAAAFGWETGDARDAMDQLVARGEAARVGSSYRLAAPVTTSR
jgi:hypothetical protein